MPDPVTTVRAFNRYYTGVVGALGATLLETPYSLTEARVLFELGAREVTDVVALRRELGLDAGYLSRILTRLEDEGLAIKERSPDDRRRNLIRPTAAGRAAFEDLDRRATEEVAEQLARLSEAQRARLLGAMGAIKDILGERGTVRAFVLRPLRPGDYGWVASKHGELYAREYGWDETFEALVARIVADHIEQRDLKRDAAWIAEVDGERVGCVFCVEKEATVAQLRLLLVDPKARGMGIGARLVEECVRFATGAGYRRMMLWTNDVLVDAGRIYERAGFKLTKEEPHHSFGHDLVSQDWWLDLPA